jgi:G:T/U-mismatch repair DNA glycosylase
MPRQESIMLREIWEPDLSVVFVGPAVEELSDTLGFYHLHPRNRFWELLEIGGITPTRIITSSERKALADGYARGSLSDPVRSMFIQKKTSQLLRLGIGLTDLNRRVIAVDDKDKAARPTDEDIQQFIGRAPMLNARVLAFVTKPDLFVDLFTSRYPAATATLGPQSFTIGVAEVWLLGSPGGLLRGEALTKQEDAFLALGERILGLKEERAKG